MQFLLLAVLLHPLTIQWTLMCMEQQIASITISEHDTYEA